MGIIAGGVPERQQQQAVNSHTDQQLFRGEFPSSRNGSKAPRPARIDETLVLECGPSPYLLVELIMICASMIELSILVVCVILVYYGLAAECGQGPYLSESGVWARPVSPR